MEKPPGPGCAMWSTEKGKPERAQTLNTTSAEKPPFGQLALGLNLDLHVGQRDIAEEGEPAVRTGEG